MISRPVLIEPNSGPPERVRVFDRDPDLCISLPDEERTLASELVAPLVEAEAGTRLAWDHVDRSSTVGALLLQGIIGVRTFARGRAHLEILGPGDLLRPWPDLDRGIRLDAGTEWTVIESAQLALLDRAFGSALLKWPAVLVALSGRWAARCERLRYQLAVRSIPRIDERLEMILWELAGRFGRVSRDWILLDLELTHAMLAEMVGARRPSVSTAVAALRRKGILEQSKRGRWMLRRAAAGQSSADLESSAANANGDPGEAVAGSASLLRKRDLR